MGFEFDAPDESDMPAEGNYLRKPGWYHLQITHTDEQPTDQDGGALNGFKVEMSVLDGARENGECPEKRKKIDLVFFNPKLNSKDGGKWAKAKQTCFMIAAGLMTEADMGKRLTINLDDARDRQVVAEFSLQEGKKYLELNYANIYHIDDPRGKDCPKDAKAIALIPKVLRRDPASFKTAGKNGEAANGKATGQPAGKQTAGAASTADDDLGNL